jgi:hypothetical protein
MVALGFHFGAMLGAKLAQSGRKIGLRSVSSIFSESMIVHYTVQSKRLFTIFEPQDGFKASKDQPKTTSRIKMLVYWLFFRIDIVFDFGLFGVRFWLPLGALLGFQICQFWH